MNNGLLLMICKVKKRILNIAEVMAGKAGYAGKLPKGAAETKAPEK